MIDNEKRTILKRKIDSLLVAAQEYTKNLVQLRNKVTSADNEEVIVSGVLAAMDKVLEETEEPADEDEPDIMKKLQTMDFESNQNHKNYLVKMMEKFTVKEKLDIPKWTKAVSEGKFPEPPV